MSDIANAAQRLHWNSEVRLQAWRRREALTTTVVPVLIKHAALVGGERVLDVGCGGGRTTIAAAQAVRPDGEVVGADISAPLVTLARQRAAAGGISNARFLVTDAQQMDLGEAPFDTAVSQFGVMFFDETVTAFASIRSHVRPGGRLTFICWQALADNPWYTGPALAPFCPPAAAPAPGKNATGPFTLADPEYTAGILTAAGWSAVERTTYRRTVSLEREVLADEDSYLRYLGVTEDRLAAARAASDRQLAPLLGRDGRYDAPLAFQVFTART